MSNIAPAIIQHGTDEQKQRWMPCIAYGEEYWAQFFSEPGAGSDLAGLARYPATAGEPKLREAFERAGAVSDGGDRTGDWVRWLDDGELEAAAGLQQR